MHVNIEALSGIFGSISIACWVVVFSPQIIENWRRSSTEGLSIVFLVVWLAGDVFNIIGGVLQGVLPTMIILAVYYTLADVVLILQCFYYRGFTLKDTVQTEPASARGSNQIQEPTERSALLSNGHISEPSTEHAPPLSADSRSTDPNQVLPARSPHSQYDIDVQTGQKPIQKPIPFAWTVLVNSAAVIAVCAAGVLGWWLSTMAPGHSHDKPKKPDWKHEDGSSQRSDLEFSPMGQFFGYFCTVFYLGSRIPQLLLNYRRKSTEGISMLFFIFACVGNATYVVSILAYEPACFRESQYFVPLKHHNPVGCEPGEAEKMYARNILVNMSWLLGSAGTLFLDAAVFVQWYIYRNPSGNKGGDNDENHNDNPVDTTVG